VNKDVGL